MGEPLSSAIGGQLRLRLCRSDIAAITAAAPQRAECLGELWLLVSSSPQRSQCGDTVCASTVPRPNTWIGTSFSTGATRTITGRDHIYAVPAAATMRPATATTIHFRLQRTAMPLAKETHGS